VTATTDVCINCNKRPVDIKKRKLCKRCYAKVHYREMVARNPGLYNSNLAKEVEFIKNFFVHNNWIYHPTIFRLSIGNYEPDFYDGKRNVFIEVSGTTQAFYANFEKYKLFVKTFPLIKFEIRNSLGEIKPLTKRAYAKKQVAAHKKT